MTKCKSCGAAGQDGKFCDECGESLVESTKGYGPLAVAVVVAVLAVGAFVFLIAPSNGSAVVSNAPAPASSNVVVEPVVSNEPVTEPETRTLVATISGMTCGGCVAGIERKVGALDGVVSVSVYLRETKGEVEYDPAVISKQKILDTITNYGYPASEVSDSSAGINKVVVGSVGSTGSSCGSGSGGCGCGG